MGAATNEVADAMYEMVKEYHGKRNLKAMDLVDKKQCKQAIRELVDSGRCTYSYVGGSYIVLPPDSPDAK
jgi:hypothetical protein